MTNKQPQNSPQIMIAIVLVAIIILSGLYSLTSYNRIKNRSLIATYRNKINTLLSQNHSSLSAKDTNMIDTWMTFGYINMIFKLPPDYLKTNLNISDSHYPNLSLTKYIKSNKLDRNTFLAQVRSVVTDYFTNK